MASRTPKRSGRKVDKTGRSVGESPFIMLPHWLFDSPAYRSLSPVARCLYGELKRLYRGSNNGALFLSVRDAATNLRIGKSTASVAFKDLQDRGFIRLNRRGAFNLKSAARRGEASTWILTEYEFANQLPTKDFMHWKEKAQKNLTVRNGGQTVRVEGQATQTSPQVSLSPDAFDG